MSVFTTIGNGFSKLFGGRSVGAEPKEKSLKDIVPIYRMEGDIIILKDGRAGIGFEIEGAPFEKMIDEEYEIFCRTFESAALALPKHYIVQKIDVYANAYYPLGRDANNFQQKGFFEQKTIHHFSRRPVLRQTSYLFICSDKFYNTSVKGNAFTASVATGGKANNRSMKDIEKRIAAVRHHAQSFIETIISIGSIRASRMNAVDMRNLYYQFLNLDFSGSVNEPYKQLYSDGNVMAVGEKKVNIVSAEEMSSEVFYSVPNSYGIDSSFTWRLGVYLPFPHITSTAFYVDDTQNVISSLQRKRTITANTGVLGGEEATVKANEINEYINAVLENHSRFLSVSLHVLLYSNNDQLRVQHVQELADAFRATGMKPIVETFDNMLLYFSMFPAAAGYSNRWLLMESTHAACLINPSSEFFSKSQGDYVCDRSRNMVYIDASFNRNLNNQNTIVVGPPGSGKSFTMGHFIIQRYERKERQIIIDVGGTYRNIFDALGCNDAGTGVKYFEYSPEKPIRFNPFLCPLNKNGQYEISEDKVNFIITLLGLINKRKDETWNNDEWSILQLLVPKYYEYVNKRYKKNKNILPRLDDFYEWFMLYQDENKNKEEFKKQANKFDFYSLENTLTPFATGKFKELLNSDDTLDISEYRLVCFDMARVKDDLRMYALVSLLLIELTIDVVRKFPEDRKYFTMDEAWSMLTDTMGSFVEYMFRTIRKNNGSVTIITQGVDELNTEIGNVIKNNAETKIILNHTNDKAIDKVAQAFGFTKSGVQKIRSIRVSKDAREVFIDQGGESMVFILEAPPAEHAILTSNPVERNHLNNLKKLYPKNIQAAINQWVEDKEDNAFAGK